MRRVGVLPALLAGAALLPGCRVGGWRDMPELAPFGDQVEVETAYGEFTGELLLVEEEGIVLLQDRAYAVPWPAVRKIDFKRFPYDDYEADGNVPGDLRRGVIARASRYPQGLTDEQLARLLEALGQEELEALPGAPEAPEASASSASSASTARAPRAATAGAETSESSALEPPEPLDPTAAAFVEAVRDAASRFEDRAHAQRAGYRRIGPDFPGMGEHWVHPGRAMAASLDPGEPAILSYAVRDGSPVLLGVAFALPLAPDDDPPATPFDPSVWHDHSGAVDEELLLLNHPASADMAGGGHRLAVVHVWTGLANPDGVLAQNNWALPFWREGLPLPRRPSAAAARGVSLANGGRSFYRELIDRAARLEKTEVALVAAALDRAASAAEAAIARQRALGPDATIDGGRFAGIWDSFWRDVRASVSAEAWASLRDLAAPPGS